MRLVQLVDADAVHADGSMSLVDPYRQPCDILPAGVSLTLADLLTPTGLAAVKAHADGVGPWNPHLVTTVNDGIDRNGDGARLQALVGGAIGRACGIGFPQGFKRVFIK